MKLRRHRHAELPAETSERMIPTDIIAFAAESIMYPQKPGEIPAARQPCAAPDTASTSPAQAAASPSTIPVKNSKNEIRNFIRGALCILSFKYS